MSATILFVADDTSTRTDWKALLQNYGYKFFAADNGSDALVQCSRLQPDLVLIEGSLPDVDSSELCRQLKGDPLTQLTPVVLIMPWATPFEASKQKENSADDFWARPGSRWEALNRVQAVLHLKSYIDRQAESVIFTLARSIDAKDPSAGGHSDRVREYSMQLGKSLHLSETDLEALRLASIVHDIGKVGVPDSILFKPERLSPAEMEVIRQHPVLSESICAPLKSFRDALPIIRHHHERIDGSGYPDGLAGDRIPFMARILQIADIYDALTSDRPYRAALPPEPAISVLWTEARRGWLDGSLVARFRELCEMEHFPMRRKASMVSDYYMSGSSC